jgi:pSer/pThr/pTyr-binding forkhead associated (FHA) protein/tetratricopeptide (TPR) repeat protein
VKLSVSKRNQTPVKIDLGNVDPNGQADFSIGREKGSAVELDDRQISRHFADLIHNRGKWTIKKLSADTAASLNGTGLSSTEVELNPGDSLVVGIFRIDFEESEFLSTNQTQSSFSFKPEPIPQVSTQAPVQESAPIVHVETRPQAAPVENTYVDDEATKEINVADMQAQDNDQTEDSIIAPDEDLSSNLNEPSNESSLGLDDGTSGGDDFVFTETSDSDVEEGLAMSNESAASEAAGDDPYSLANIDSGLDENEGTKILQSFAKIQLELYGETAPYDVYLVEKAQTFIGRDPAKCQIVLNDPEVSSQHAVIKKNNVELTIEDLGSSNGTILNGNRIKKSNLIAGDEFVIGGVTFTVRYQSEFLSEESSNVMPVDAYQTVEVEEVVEVESDDVQEESSIDNLGGFTDTGPKEKSIIKQIQKDPEMRKKALYAIVLLVAAWVFLGEPDKPAPPPKASPNSIVKKEKPKEKTKGKKISEEERQALSARYEIGKNHANNGRYREALEELNKVAAVDPNFTDSLPSLIALSKEGLSKLEEVEKKRIAEEQAAIKKKQIAELIKKAQEYTKDRRVELATETFNEIAKIDPENMEVPKLKMELEDWQKEKLRKEVEEASKKKAREDKIEKLKPSKNLYVQKEWFKAISKLEDFLKIKDMDEDLTKEATEMLRVSREEINNSVAPLQGKAKSLLEGQDLKGAYEIYQQILKIEPSNSEALNQVVDIKEQLTAKARKIYREAIISESLSLFQDAKEKFQEVQQISPVDSDYYKKASDKLKDYLE